MTKIEIITAIGSALILSILIMLVVYFYLTDKNDPIQHRDFEMTNYREGIS